MTNISTATPAALRETVRTMRAENLDASTQLDLIRSNLSAEDADNDPGYIAHTVRAGKLFVLSPRRPQAPSNRLTALPGRPRLAACRLSA